MKAVCRVAKIKGAGTISGESDHDYHQGHVPNADLKHLHLDPAFILIASV